MRVENARPRMTPVLWLKFQWQGYQERRRAARLFRDEIAKQQVSVAAALSKEMDEKLARMHREYAIKCAMFEICSAEKPPSMVEVMRLMHKWEQVLANKPLDPSSWDSLEWQKRL